MFAGMLAMIMLTNQSERWQGQQARSEEIQRNLDTLGVSPKINAILTNRDNRSSSSDKPNWEVVSWCGTIPPETSCSSAVAFPKRLPPFRFA